MKNNKIANKKEAQKEKNKVNAKAMRNILDASIDDIISNTKNKED